MLIIIGIVVILIVVSTNDSTDIEISNELKIIK